MTTACPVHRGENGNWVFTGYAEVLGGDAGRRVVPGEFPRSGCRGAAGGAVRQRDPRAAPRPGPQDHQLGDRQPPAHRRRAALRAAVPRPADRPSRTRRAGRPGHRIRDAGAEQRSSPTCSAPNRATTRSGPAGRRRSSQGTYPSPLPQRARGRARRARTRNSPPTSTRIIADRRAHPRDDFVTRLISREVDGRTLTDIEARAQLVFLFISGNETTRHLHRQPAATGSPQIRNSSRSCAADRTLIEAAIEESLRLDPPVRLLMRTCSAETVMAGEQIAPGEQVIFGVAEANRDDAALRRARGFPRSTGPTRGATWRSAVARTSAPARTWPAWRRGSR